MLSMFMSKTILEDSFNTIHWFGGASASFAYRTRIDAQHRLRDYNEIGFYVRTIPTPL